MPKFILNMQEQRGDEFFTVAYRVQGNTIAEAVVDNVTNGYCFGGAELQVDHLDDVQHQDLLDRQLASEIATLGHRENLDGYRIRGLLSWLEV